MEMGEKRESCRAEMVAYSGNPRLRGWDSKVPMQPRKETSPSSSTVFQVTKSGADAAPRDSEDIDVAGVEEDQAGDAEDEDSEESASAARRRRAGALSGWLPGAAASESETELV
jgi:hypothetical protein